MTTNQQPPTVAEMSDEELIDDLIGEATLLARREMRGGSWSNADLLDLYAELKRRLSLARLDVEPGETLPFGQTWHDCEACGMRFVADTDQECLWAMEESRVLCPHCSEARPAVAEGARERLARWFYEATNDRYADGYVAYDRIGKELHAVMLDYADEAIAALAPEPQP